MTDDLEQAINYIKETIQRREAGIKVEVGYIVPSDNEVKEQLDLLIRDPMNLNYASRLLGAWESLRYHVQNIQREAGEAHSLQRALEVLQKEQHGD